MFSLILTFFQAKSENPRPNPSKTAQPPTRRPGYRSKVAKRPAAEEINEEEAGAEEPVAPPPKVAKTIAKISKVSTKTAPQPPADDDQSQSDDEMSSSSRVGSQNSMLSVEAVPESGRDSK